MSFGLAAMATAGVASALAGSVAAGTISAGLAAGLGTAAGIAAGAGVAGAAGAALGAGTSALTGGDVGKGALMGGVTGLAGGAVGGIASAAGAGATAAGAVGGAAGGAAGAASGGEDPLKGALIGGVVGGAGGALSPEAAAGATTPQAGQPISPTASSGGIGSIKAPSPVTSVTPQGLSNVPSLPSTNTGAINNALPTAQQFSPTVAGDSYGIKGVQGYTPSVEAPVAPVKVPTRFEQGINLIKEHPAEAMQIGGAGINMLSTPQDQQFPQGQPINTTNYLSPNFQRYEATPTYADGGAVGYEPSVTMYGGAADGYAEGGMPQQAPQGAMNPIVAKAMAATQQAQQAEQAQQASIQPMQPAPIQPQAQPITPPQGIAPPQGIQPIAPPQGIAQPQIQPVGMASGGITDGYSLGGYAHGGIPRLLSGEGDGVSDDIPATIGPEGKQPARLADGEYVISARIVSELGNGSTKAGAKRLKEMTDRIQARRSKSIGKGKVAVDSKAVKDLPA